MTEIFSRSTNTLFFFPYVHSREIARRDVTLYLLFYVFFFFSFVPCSFSPLKTMNFEGRASITAESCESEGGVLYEKVYLEST